MFRGPVSSSGRMGVAAPWAHGRFTLYLLMTTHSLMKGGFMTLKTFGKFSQSQRRRPLAPSRAFPWVKAPMVVVSWEDGESPSSPLPASSRSPTPAKYVTIVALWLNRWNITPLCLPQFLLPLLLAIICSSNWDLDLLYGLPLYPHDIETNEKGNRSVNCFVLNVHIHFIEYW